MIVMDIITSVTIDYASANVDPISGGGIDISVTKDENGKGQGARLSTTRFHLYGKFTLKMKASPIRGIITTFSTYTLI
jgi:phosphatidate phosphatase PAH1